MTKRELATRISTETGFNQRDVLAVIHKTLDYIIESLARNESVEFRNFGVFEVRVRKSRVGRNPNKPTNVVTIPTRKVVKFKMGKIMKAQIMTPIEQAPAGASAPVVSAPDLAAPASNAP